MIMLLATPSMARSRAGARCWSNRQCASGICQRGVCRGSPRHLTRRRRSGARCTRNSQCASGRCWGPAGARRCRWSAW